MGGREHVNTTFTTSTSAPSHLFHIHTLHLIHSPPHLPSTHTNRTNNNRSTPLLTLTSIQTPPPPSPTHPRKTPDFVSVHLLLVRLAAQSTDLLITVNVPHYPGEYVKAEAGSDGVTQLMRDGQTTREKVRESFEVKDFGLFAA